MQITSKWLRDRMDYDAASGILTWKDRPAGDFKTERDRNAWNTRYSGTEVGAIDANWNGYRAAGIGKTSQKVHRLVWLYVYGEWPTGYIDHINGVRSDNCVANLRDVTSAESSKNIGISSRNTSGVTGVSWFSRTQKWTAAITVAGKTKRLGYFETLDEASRARKLAEVDYGFHANHGRPLKCLA